MTNLEKCNLIKNYKEIFSTISESTVESDGYMVVPVIYDDSITYMVTLYEHQTTDVIFRITFDSDLEVKKSTYFKDGLTEPHQIKEYEFIDHQLKIFDNDSDRLKAYEYYSKIFLNRWLES